MIYISVKLTNIPELRLKMCMARVMNQSYLVKFRGINFSVLFNIDPKGYTVLVGAEHPKNKTFWSATIEIRPVYKAYMAEEDIRLLRDFVGEQLSPSQLGECLAKVFVRTIDMGTPSELMENKFDSTLLQVIAKESKKNDGKNIGPFIRWMKNSTGHSVSKENLRRTELSFGKKTAEYCRECNISSCWEHVPADANVKSAGLNSCTC